MEKLNQTIDLLDQAEKLIMEQWEAGAPLQYVRSQVQGTARLLRARRADLLHHAAQDAKTAPGASAPKIS